MNNQTVKPNIPVESIYEKAYFALVLLLWCESSILPFCRALLLPLGSRIADLFIPSLIIVTVTSSLPYLIRSIRGTDLIFYFFAALLFLLQYFLFPNNQSYIRSNAASVLLTCFPLLLVGVGLDIEKIGKKMYFASVLSVWLQTIYILFFKRITANTVNDGSMNLSYAMLPHVCWVMCSCFDRPSAINIITAALGGIMLFSLGTRGSMLCLLIFVAAYLFLFKKYKYPWYTKSFVILTFVLAVVFFYPILNLFGSISEKLGLSTRLLSRVSENTFFVSLGRDNIRTALLESLASRPMVGYGLYADRITAGSYSHNILLELCYSFGYPIGCFLFVGLAVLLFKTLKRCRRGAEQAFVLVLICSFFVKLFLSGSFLSEKGLYLLIGMCAGVIHRGGMLPLLPDMQGSQVPSFSEKTADREMMLQKETRR